MYCNGNDDAFHENFLWQGVLIIDSNNITHNYLQADRLPYPMSSKTNWCDSTQGIVYCCLDERKDAWGGRSATGIVEITETLQGHLGPWWTCERMPTVKLSCTIFYGIITCATYILIIIKRAPNSFPGPSFLSCRICWQRGHHEIKSKGLKIAPPPSRSTKKNWNTSLLVNNLGVETSSPRVVFSLTEMQFEGALNYL